MDILVAEMSLWADMVVQTPAAVAVTHGMRNSVRVTFNSILVHLRVEVSAWGWMTSIDIGNGSASEITFTEIVRPGVNEAERAPLVKELWLLSDLIIFTSIQLVKFINRQLKLRLGLGSFSLFDMRSLGRKRDRRRGARVCLEVNFLIGRMSLEINFLSE